MKLPAELYLDLAAQYSITLSGLKPGDTVSGVRIQGAGEPIDEALYLPADLPPAFINEALALTERYGSWLTLLDIHAGNGASPQALIDLSEPILNQPLFLVDPSMKRIAATEHIFSEDTFYSEILAQGYPNLSTYDRLKRGNYYAPQFYTGQVMRLSTSDIPSKEVALKGIRLGGKLAATALMLFQNEPWSAGKAALFEQLTLRLANSLEHPWIQADSRSQQYDFLLRDLLGEKKLPEEEINARLRYSHRDNPCPCHAVIFSGKDMTSAKRGYICRILDSVFPGTRPLICENRVFTLLPMRTQDREAALDRLEQFCSDTECSCGVSSVLYSLAGVRDAYIQATETQQLGLALSRDGTWYSQEENSRRVRAFCHDDFSVYRMIRAFTKTHPSESLVRRELLQLQRQDAENGTDNMRILFHFLHGHLNYTEAARRLYMHRNSVFYRIERICALIDVSRIDPALEKGLLFSYMVLDAVNLSEFSTEQL